MNVPSRDDRVEGAPQRAEPRNSAPPTGHETLSCGAVVSSPALKFWKGWWGIPVKQREVLAGIAEPGQGLLPAHATLTTQHPIIEVEHPALFFLSAR